MGLAVIKVKVKPKGQTCEDTRGTATLGLSFVEAKVRSLSAMREICLMILHWTHASWSLTGIFLAVNWLLDLVRENNSKRWLRLVKKSRQLTCGLLVNS